jgi:acyl carrier protein
MDIENKIRQFILQNLYFADDGPIGDEDSFLDTGVIDSMGVMELVAFIQSEFSFEVPQQEIVVENFDSIRKLADYVGRKLPLKQPAKANRAESNLTQTAPLFSQS